jgi:hypothetical protein
LEAGALSACKKELCQLVMSSSSAQTKRSSAQSQLKIKTCHQQKDKPVSKEGKKKLKFWLNI